MEKDIRFTFLATHVGMVCFIDECFFFILHKRGQVVVSQAPPLSQSVLYDGFEMNKLVDSTV